MVHARPIRRCFNSQDDKINQKASSSETKNINHYYIRTPPFNYLIKYIHFVQARYTDFQIFLIMYSSKLLKGDVPGVKEFIQNLLITPEAKQYDQYDKMLITIQSKNHTYDIIYA